MAGLCRTGFNSELDWFSWIDLTGLVSGLVLYGMVSGLIGLLRSGFGSGSSLNR